MGFFRKIQKNGAFSFKNLKKNMLFRMIVLYSTFICVVVYIMSAILMHYTNKNLSEKIYISNLNSLKIMQVYCDSNILQQVNDIILTMQLEKNGKTKVHHFMKLKEKVTEKDIYEVYVELGSLVVENPMIESIEIYNRNNQVAVSSSAGVSFVEDTSYYESLFEDVRGSVWTQSVGKHMEVISTFPLHISSQEKNSCGIIKINSENMMEMLKSQNGKENDIEFFITDKDFNVLISTADEKLQVEFSKKALPHEVNEIVVENEKYQTFYVDSEGGDWKYFYVIPPTLYEDELKALRTVSFWNTFSMVILSLLGLALISIWFYRPIKELMQALKKLRKKEPTGPDMSFINDEIYSLISQVDEVNSVITKNLPLIRSQFLAEIVYGAITWDNFSERIVELERDFEMKNLVPAVICLSDKILSSIDVKQESFIQLMICELFYNIETDDCKCITAKVSDSCVAVLASFKNAEDTETFFESVWKDICELGVCNLNLIVADESEVTEDIGITFRKMLELRKYSFVYGWGNKLKISTLVKREGKDGPESAEILSSRMKKFFNLKDSDSVCTMLSSFYKACMETDYSYAYIEKCFLSFMQVVSSALFDLDGADTKKISSDELSTMHDIYDYMMHVIESSCSVNDSIYISSEAEMINNVKKYISDNIGSDISQISVARAFNISAEHLSRTFKRVHGSKFSDFVAETKLKAAARMLCDNKKMTVKKAAEAVGYYNINYFTMLFKKYYNLTPSQYRKANMSKETPKS